MLPTLTHSGCCVALVVSTIELPPAAERQAVELLAVGRSRSSLQRQARGIECERTGVPRIVKNVGGRGAVAQNRAICRPPEMVVAPP